MALIVLALSGEAAAQKPAVELGVDAVLYERGYNKAVVRVKNVGAKALGTVMVDCAFLANGKALATSAVVLANLAPGDTGFETVMSRSAAADEARCRVTQAR
jgi:hypothetical protein